MKRWGSFGLQRGKRLSFSRSWITSSRTSDQVSVAALIALRAGAFSTEIRLAALRRYATERAGFGNDTGLKRLTDPGHPASDKARQGGLRLGFYDLTGLG